MEQSVTFVFYLAVKYYEYYIDEILKWILTLKQYISWNAIHVYVCISMCPNLKHAVLVLAHICIYQLILAINEKNT